MTIIQTHADTQMPLRMAHITDVAEGIRSFDLLQLDGAELPPFTPGSHIKVQVPNGLLRKYSLCNNPAERYRYVITVKRDAQGQGGSLSLCDEAREGDTLPTSLPDNAFPLVEDAKGYSFIAGGIGITPILSMIRNFGELPSAPWKLYYLGRSPESTAFLEDLSAPVYKGKVVIHHDLSDPANSLDLWPVLVRPRAGTHIYCCGPRHGRAMAEPVHALRELQRRRRRTAGRQAFRRQAGQDAAAFRGACGQDHTLHTARARLRRVVFLRERYLRQLPHDAAFRRGGPSRHGADARGDGEPDNDLRLPLQGEDW